MLRLELSWPQAVTATLAMTVATAALRLARRPRLAALATFTQETALVLGLFALWQYAGSFSAMGPGGAVGRGWWLWHLERALHLPSETGVQRLFLRYPLIVQAFNLYYDGLHFPVMIACMVWLFVTQRDHYRRLRTTIVAFTGICLLVQLIPVAPPRMLPRTGLVDTAVLYHESVYSTRAGFDPDQLSAMPSVHVGWAILVAIVLISAVRSRWRWLALLYPAFTLLAVIVTANHFWLDGVAAAIILAVVLLAQHAGRRLAAAVRPGAIRPDGNLATAWPAPGPLADVSPERRPRHPP